MAKTQAQQSVEDQLKNLRTAREEADLWNELQSTFMKDINKGLGSMFKHMADIALIESNLGKLRKQQLKFTNEINSLESKIANAKSNQQTDLEEKYQSQLDVAREMNRSILRQIASSEQQISLTTKELSLREAIKNSMLDAASNGGERLINATKGIWTNLKETDQLLRNASLELGHGAEMAGQLRTNLIGASLGAARLGAGADDLLKMQTEYSNLTGKATALSTENLKQLAAIAKGTSLGVEGAGELAGTMDAYGDSVERAYTLVGDLNNSSKQVGLSSKIVLNNFKGILQQGKQFSFTGGRAAMAEMAKSAAMLKFSVEGAFASADKVRTLEGALEASANLIMLGGKFSNADPLKLAYLARTDPGKLSKAYAEMTQGLASFSQATGEFNVSAYDMDRLRQAADATGKSLGEMRDIAIQTSKMDVIGKQLLGGATQDQKEMVATLAQFKDGKFQVQIGKDWKSVRDLTGKQIDALKQQKQTLEQSAKQAQGFDKSLETMITGFKASFAPLLEKMIPIMEIMGKVVDKIYKVFDAMGGGPGALIAMLAGGYGLKAAGSELARSMIGSIGGSGLMGKIGSLFKGAGSGMGGAAGAAAKGAGGVSQSIAGATSGMSMAGAATIGAYGVAFTGLGLGIKFAADGFATIGDMVHKLTGPETVATIGAFALGLWGLTAAVTAVGAASANPITAAGLIAIGAVSLSMLGIGKGIEMATNGIGNMFSKLRQLGDVDLSGIGKALAPVASIMMGDGGGLADLKAMLETITSVQTDTIDRLEAIMQKGIKLELTGDTNLKCNIEIINNLDGEKFVSRFSKQFQVAISQAAKGQRAL